MKILDVYISKIILSHILIVILVLLGLFAFVSFIDELGDLNKGNYGIVQIAQYVFLSVPKVLYEVFPMAVLIGSIMGLSLLARDSELIVMRAAGMSIWQIVFCVMKVGVLLAMIAMVMGEIVSPITETKARKIQAESLQDNKIQQKSNFGLWLRDDNSFVNIGEILPDFTLLKVKIFEFDQENFLRFLSTADRGEFSADANSPNNGKWLLQGLKRTMIDNESSAADDVVAAYWNTSVKPDILRVFMIQPDQLSLWELNKYIKHLRSNKQKTNNYELAFWSKVVTPFATIVMLILAIPFVFKNTRSGGLGKSLFMGVMIGLAFFILERAFGFFVPLFAIPPLLGAIIPTLLVFALSVFLLRRIV